MTKPTVPGTVRRRPAAGAGSAAQLQALHHRGAHRHRARTDAVFLVTRQMTSCPIRVSVWVSRDTVVSAIRSDWKFQLPAAFHVSSSAGHRGSRYHLNDVPIACEIAGEHSLFA
jgi:hypothetical protein